MSYGSAQSPSAIGTTIMVALNHSTFRFALLFLCVIRCGIVRDFPFYLHSNYLISLPIAMVLIIPDYEYFA